MRFARLSLLATFLMALGCASRPAPLQPAQPCPVFELPPNKEYKYTTSSALSDKYYRYHMAGAGNDLYIYDLVDGTMWQLTQASSQAPKWTQIEVPKSLRP